MAVNIDLHTHSVASPDGSLRLEDYRLLLERDTLGAIAVTDHNSIKNAIEIQQVLGERIIVGEEIMSLDGEVIGLYLHQSVPAGLSAAQTVQAIRDQQGIVYVPHPFETVRRGLPLAVLDSLADHIDIIEVHNGRALFQNKNNQASVWAIHCKIAGAASSDAHGLHGWGRTYSVVATVPTRETLVELLRTAEYHVASPGLRGVAYPKYNRLRKRLGHA